MSAMHPYYISDEEDEFFDGRESSCELLDYDSDSEPEIIDARLKTPATASSSGSTPSRKQRFGCANDEHTLRLPDSEVQTYELRKGVVIKVGTTVELRDHSSENAGNMHSGDFLRVKQIIMNLETDAVRIRGYRLRRTKYLHQIFDWKLNELCMVLRINEDDNRCPFVAGIEEVDIDEVIGIRECTLTNKPYPFLTFRTDGRCAYPASMTNEEVKQQIFHGGRLACRVVVIQFVRATTGKSYSGLVRHLYAHESDTEPVQRAYLQRPNSSCQTFIIAEDAAEDDDVVVVSLSGKGKRRARSDSVEELEFEPLKRKNPLSSKTGGYTMGDTFCGGGGASQGAAQAGLIVAWGLDNEERALKTYRLNHPSAKAFQLDAHDFPPPGVRKELLRVDVLHLSPPCCFWSPAHTHEGRNDQANYEAIYTVGPILEKVKPRIATLEQTSGLLESKQHIRNFQLLLYDIGRAGYDVRYKIENLANHGLVQKRKRLLMIAARRGTPLPPFPKATHGPEGSGLQPHVSIKEALAPLERQGSRALEDWIHAPTLFRESRPPLDANGPLKACITTSGGDNYHYSGTRRYTARELALFQGFPITYRFSGKQGDIVKQIGNAFPPVMAEAMFRVIIKTLKAFDDGLISTEDSLDDIDALIKRKSTVAVQEKPSSYSFFGNRSRRMSLPLRSTPAPQSSIFAMGESSSSRKHAVQPAKASSSCGHSFTSLLGGLFGSSKKAPAEQVKPAQGQDSGATEHHHKNIIIIDDSD
ncbi:hypothetical protein ACN47E_007832 [Coniothyrium glycines]